MSLVRKIILVLCAIVFIGSASVLIDYFVKGMKEQNALEALDAMRVEVPELKTDKGIVIGRYVNLYKKNSDIIGWVTVEGTKINYPVMQTQDDPEFYLHRDFNKEYSAGGVPFMDADSDIFKPTSNFMIYGHHMKNGTMFHDLIKYESKDFWKKHKTFTFDTIYKGGQGTYQVVAACYSQIYPADSANFKYYTYAGMVDEEEFYEYINGVRSIACYDTGVAVEYGDQLVTLSTCAYQTDEGRFFIVGKRIDTE